MFSNQLNVITQLLLVVDDLLRDGRSAGINAMDYHYGRTVTPCGCNAQLHPKYHFKLRVQANAAIMENSQTL